MIISKIEIIEFDNTDARDNYLDNEYPKRRADRNECGLYHIENGILLVRLNKVEINRKFKIDSPLIKDMKENGWKFKELKRK